MFKKVLIMLMAIAIQACIDARSQDLAGVADAKTPQPLSECSPVMENRDRCLSTLWTYEPPHQDGPPILGAATSQASYSPIAIRARPAVQVTVQIHKRPLEQVNVAKTYNQQVKPEPINAILTQVSKPLSSGLTVLTALSPATGGAAAASTNNLLDFNTGNSHSFSVLPTTKQKAQRDQAHELIEAFGKEIEAVDALQQSIYQVLSDDLAIAPDLTREISDAQLYPPNVDTHGRWSSQDEKVFEECVQNILARIQGDAPTTPGDSCGKEVGSHPSLRSRPYVLPVKEFVQEKSKLSLLGPDLDGLKKKLQTLSAGEEPELVVFATQVAQLSARQDSLSGAYGNAQTTQQTFQSYKSALPDCLQYGKSCESDEASSLVNYSVTINRFPPPKGTNSGSEQVSAAFTAQPLLVQPRALERSP